MKQYLTRALGQNRLLYKGFSLIETSIAMGLATLMVLMVTQFFIWCWKNYLNLTQELYQKEEIQVAFEYLRLPLMNAGFWGCGTHAEKFSWSWDSHFSWISHQDVEVLSTSLIHQLQKEISRKIAIEFPVLAVRQLGVAHTSLFSAMLTTRTPLRLSHPLPVNEKERWWVGDCAQGETFIVRKVKTDPLIKEIVELSHDPMAHTFNTNAIVGRLEERYFFLSPVEGTSLLELCEKMRGYPMHCFAEGIEAWQLRFYETQGWNGVWRNSQDGFPSSAIQAIEVTLKTPSTTYTTAYPILNRQF